MCLRIMAFLFFAVSTARLQATENVTWRFPWEAGAKPLLCEVIETDSGNFVFDRLVIRSPQGETLLSRDPQGAFLGANSWAISHTENLLLTEWSAGASAFMLLVFRHHGGRIAEVGRIFFHVGEYGLVPDPTSDRSQLLVWERTEIPGIPYSARPFHPVLYRWSAGSVKRVRAPKCLLEVFTHAETRGKR